MGVCVLVPCLVCPPCLAVVAPCFTIVWMVRVGSVRFELEVETSPGGPPSTGAARALGAGKSPARRAHGMHQLADGSVRCPGIATEIATQTSHNGSRVSAR